MAINTRRVVSALIAIYIWCFQWMYVHFLYPSFDYLGFQFNSPSPPYLVLAWVLTLLPCLWMPIALTRASQMAYWVLYIAVFIPSMFVPLYAEMEPAQEIAVLMLVLFAGFAIIGCTYLMPLWNIKPPQLSSRALRQGVAVGFAALTVWMILVFHNHLRIVSFDDIYDLRDAANDVAEGSAVNYAFMLLTGAIDPFLMGYGLFYRRRWLFICGAAGQLLVYSVGGTKGSILSILFIPAVYFLLQLRKISFGTAFSLGCVTLLGGCCAAFLASGEQPGILLSVALFVVCARTLGMGGLLTAQYYDFFQRNPLTFWSHIKGISWFIHYPYQYPIGQELGIAYAGTTDLDATTHFLATDGIEAAGLPGILLIACFCAIVFWVLDSASQKHDPRLAALITTYAAYNLANISIFTSLLSGGLALLIALLYFLPSVPEVVAHPAVPKRLQKQRNGAFGPYPRGAV
jgi:hypothetical protein